ncbi:MAG: M12 family metallopeptidase [Chitinophagaceae bacterium]
MNTIKKLLLITAVLFTLQSTGQKAKVAAKKIGQKYGCTSIIQIPKVSSFDTSAGTRGLVDPYYIWDNGATLKVRFFSGSDAMKEKVKTYAKEWEQYANINFDFVESGDADIRVNLDDKGGHNSVIGQLAQGIAQDVRTMNFDTTDFATYDAMHRTVIHEFGHAIGLLHEHYSPLAGIPWNKEVVYQELAKSQGWDKMTVDVNLFQEYSLTYTHGTSYDKTSIMHYPVLARWTTNGYAVPWNNQLSAGDKAMIAALYPKEGARTGEVPRFTITNFTKMSIVNSAEKKGLLLYPSFNIKTAGNEGQVYFTVFFYDENDNAILDNDDKYNISNVVATYKSFKLGVGQSLSANKVAPTDFELFIPYSEIPVSAGAKIKAVFKAILVDGKELKMLYSSNAVNFSVIKSK